MTSVWLVDTRLLVSDNQTLNLGDKGKFSKPKKEKKITRLCVIYLFYVTFNLLAFHTYGRQSIGFP